MSGNFVFRLTNCVARRFERAAVLSVDGDGEKRDGNDQFERHFGNWRDD